MPAPKTPEEARKYSEARRILADELEASTTWLCFVAAFAGLALAAAIIFGALYAHERNAATEPCPSPISAGAGATLLFNGSGSSCPAAVRTHLLSRLQHTRRRIRARARRARDNGGAISWATYHADPAAHAGALVHLTQGDFAHGTLRLRSPGLFVLQEDVVFEPNPHADFRPRPHQADYAGPAFVLGFFAAITIESTDVLLDLNSHMLAASPVFALQQRFMALIELASQPFLSTQGPASFGAAPGSLVAAEHCIVENGVLGRSPHHGIHGNGARHVWLRHLRLQHYEVAAIALNGAKDVLLEHVHAAGAFEHIPVLGTYSNARFLLPFMHAFLGDAHAVATVGPAKTAALSATAATLQARMDETLSDVRTHGHINAVAHPGAAALFAHPTGLNDGTSYGIIFHPRGVAVGPFWHRPVPAAGSPEACERIGLRNVSIVRTLAQVIEVVALADAHNKTIMGPVGDRLRLLDNAGRVRLYDPGSGAYVGNALSDAQIALMDASLDFAPDSPARKRLFGTLNSNAHVVAWAHGAISLQVLVGAHGHGYLRNGDTMFHVNKGVLGLRIDGTRDLCAEHVRIDNVTNIGSSGSVTRLPGEADDAAAAYVGASDGGHPQQGAQYGYMGADARGLGISGSQGVHLSHVHVRHVHADAGNARGVDFFNRAAGTYVGPDCAVHNVSTVTCPDMQEAVLRGEYVNGPRSPIAIGVCLGHAAAQATRGAYSIGVSGVRNRVLDQALDFTVDAPHEASVANEAAEALNTYEL
jgi:hypothetical protein